MLNDLSTSLHDNEFVLFDLHLRAEHVREQFVVGVMALAVLLNDSFE
jgi:hypothetical protein